MKKRLFIVAIPVVVLLAGPLVFPPWAAWSAMNCRDQEINIKTGQARYSRYLWYIKISERVEDTTLSKILGGESVHAADIAPWHMVNRFSPGRHYSPHYRFHGALHQAAEVELLFEMLEPDGTRKKQIVRDLLTLWQANGNYFGARRYLATLSEEANEVLEKKYLGSFPQSHSAARGAIPEKGP
jgi:hypothetical protein